MEVINQLPTWDDIGQTTRELVFQFSRNQGLSGLIQVYNVLQYNKFSLQEQVYIIVYLHRDNFYMSEMLYANHLFPDFRGEKDDISWVVRVLDFLDSWTDAWTIAISNGVTYRGKNSQLQSLYSIVKN